MTSSPARTAPTTCVPNCADQGRRPLRDCRCPGDRAPTSPPERSRGRSQSLKSSPVTRWSRASTGPVRAAGRRLRNVDRTRCRAPGVVPEVPPTVGDPPLSSLAHAHQVADRLQPGRPQVGPVAGQEELRLFDLGQLELRMLPQCAAQGGRPRFGHSGDQEIRQGHRVPPGIRQSSPNSLPKVWGYSSMGLVRTRSPGERAETPLAAAILAGRWIRTAAVDDVGGRRWRANPDARARSALVAARPAQWTAAPDGQGDPARDGGIVLGLMRATTALGMPAYEEIAVAAGVRGHRRGPAAPRRRHADASHAPGHPPARQSVHRRPIGRDNPINK